LLSQPLAQPLRPSIPSVYIPPVKVDPEELESFDRAETPRAPAEWRSRNFAEVEVALSTLEATREACRCLRCDLEFTCPKEPELEHAEEVEVS
jgi:NADH-quinone oxidoreductase subunit F